MKIVHIITGLKDGGAEQTLFKICKYDKHNQHIIFSLTGPGKYFLELKKLNIEVFILNLNFFSIFKLFFMIKSLRSLKPDIVQTWLIHADLIGSVAAKLAGIKNIVWNIRYSNIVESKSKFLTNFIIYSLSKLSFYLPKSIIIVSRKSIKVYDHIGYCKKKFRYIPNGYDLSILYRSNKKKILFKKKHRIKNDVPLIGCIARYDPIKDHLNLLTALSILKEKKINFYCLLIGSHINKNNIDLNSKIKNLNLSKNIKLLGKIKDISQVMNGIDLNIQSSLSEGFPNVVAESMACGTPCVVTDVGDSAYIVGKFGWVVPPKNPEKLALNIEKSIKKIGTEQWKKISLQARLRVKKNFEIQQMIFSYNKIWMSLIKQN